MHVTERESCMLRRDNHRRYLRRFQFPEYRENDADAPVDDARWILSLFSASSSDRPKQLEGYASSEARRENNFIQP